MANETEDAKPQGNVNPQAITKPSDNGPVPASPAPPPPAPAGPAPAPDTAVAAGPAPQVAFTPDGTAITAAPPQPAPQQEALIGSWLAAHIHAADKPYLAVVIVLTFLLGSFAATNTDIWHHLATGRMLSEGKYRLGQDPFAAAAVAEEGARPNTSWVNHSWLSSWIAYLLFRLDERGTVLVACKALCATALACVLLLIRPRNRHAWVGTLCVLLGVLAMSANGFLLHPMVISLLFLGITLLILYRAGVLVQSGDTAQPKVLWFLPPLFLLWINLDSWFIFGPIVVGCCLIGLLLEAGLGKKPNFSPGLLGKVLGVSMLASLFNPHHIRAVLLLPYELSYMLVRLGTFWPESMVAGGQALRMLENNPVQMHLVKTGLSPGYQRTVSPVASAFWSQTQQGLNVAGVSFFVLVALVLFSFYLCQKASPAMLLIRAVPATLCGVLALLLGRFIPLFGVVGAVIAMLNVQEYLLWRETTQPARAEEQDLWANMTRLIMGFALFGLLLLAWPGWLNYTIGDYASPRRVAWSVVADASLQETAQFLKEKNASGELKRAFNFDPNIANFCAWHAPDMHFFIDHRLPLFDREAKVYVDVQSSIFGLNGPNNKWREEFKRYGIDNVVLLTPAQIQHPYTRLFLGASFEPAHELDPIYENGRMAVIAWDRDARKVPLKDRPQLSSLQRQWRKEAFAPQEAPWPGEISLPEDVGFWGLYWHGLPSPALAAHKAQLLRVYFEAASKLDMRLSNSAFAIWELGRYGMPNNLSIGPLVLPFTIPVFIAPPEGEGKEPFVRGLLGQVLMDKGPPETAVLALRSARQAVLDDRQDPFSHRTFAQTIQFVDVLQESHWASMFSKEFKTTAQGQYLRTRLRKFQRIAALQRYLRLRPQDPSIHEELFGYYSNEGCIDMALEHLLLLGEYMDASNTEKKKEVEGLTKAFKAEVELRQANLVLRHRAEDDAVSDALNAFWGQYEVVGKDGKKHQQRMGLMKKAHDLLHEYIQANAKKDFDDRSPEAARRSFAVEKLMEIDLQTGYLWELQPIFEPEKKEKEAFANHPKRYEFKFFYYGVTGDYAKADKELEEWDKAVLPGEKGFKQAVVLELFPHFLAVAQPGTMPNYLLAYPAYNHPTYTMQTFEKMVNIFDLHRAERMTLRGILAIEAGNTKAALARFTEALKEAGPERWFIDRGIAERYQDLLELNR